MDEQPTDARLNGFLTFFADLADTILAKFALRLANLAIFQKITKKGFMKLLRNFHKTFAAWGRATGGGLRGYPEFSTTNNAQ